MIAGQDVPIYLEIGQKRIFAGSVAWPGWCRSGRDEASALAAANYMPPGMVQVPFNPTLINTGSKLVLIDTGYGPGVGPTVGLLPTHLAAAGVDPASIDIVVLSHLHPDHTNGLKKADGSLLFPNAEIKAPAPDWAFWMSEDNAGKADSPMMAGHA